MTVDPQSLEPPFLPTAVPPDAAQSSVARRHARRNAVDWTAVEREFRAGDLPLRAIAARHGVSHVTIHRHAERGGWTRPDGPVLKLAVNNVPPTAKESKSDEQGDTIQARIRQLQQGDIKRSRTLVMAMLYELEQQTGHLPLFEELAELLYPPEEFGGAKGNDKRLELFNKSISLSNRVGTMKTLSDTLKILVAMEREVFGMEQAEPELPKAADMADLTPDEAYLRLLKC